MKKYVFWSVLNLHVNVALTEDLSKYAQGDTFWKAMLNLAETHSAWIPSSSTDVSNVSERLKMYNETGINKIEIIVNRDGNRFGIQCGNSRSFYKTESEGEALMAYIETRAKTSNINTGDGGK